MSRTIASSASAAPIDGVAGVPDDLRRVQRVSVCCRVDVRGRHGVWTAVTEDVCARGCRIVTPSFPRLGSLLTMSLSSDLFLEPLDVVGETVWATSDHLGVLFVETVLRKGALSPSQWLERVLANGRVPGSAASASHVVPVVNHPRSRGGGRASLWSLPSRRIGPVAAAPAHAASPPP